MTKLLKLIALAGLLSLPFLGSGQVRTANTDGDWTTASNWAGSNVGDIISEDVVLNFDVDLALASGITIGDLELRDRSTLTLNSGADLNLGNAGAPGDLTTGNGTGGVDYISINSGAAMTVWGDVNAKDRFSVNAGGTFTIRGDLNLEDNADVVISGNVTVDGNVDMGDRASLDVSGSLTINGNLTGGADNSFTVSNVVNIAGDVTFLDRATATVSGTIGVGGTCSEGSGSTFCAATTTILPIELLSFFAQKSEDGVLVGWSTAIEENNSHFQLERSFDGRNFETIATIEGAGNSNQILQYDFVDEISYTGLVYYRLTQIDYNGDSETFKPISVELNNDFSDALLYLDDEGGFSLNHNLGEVKTFRMDLYTITGSKVLSTDQLDNNKIHFNVNVLYTGTYIVKTLINNIPFTQKILLKTY